MAGAAQLLDISRSKGDASWDGLHSRDGLKAPAGDGTRFAIEGGPGVRQSEEVAAETGEAPSCLVHIDAQSLVARIWSRQTLDP
jgi:hypothetical protein